MDSFSSSVKSVEGYFHSLVFVQEWIGQSEASPLSQHPPPSFVSAVQSILTLDNTTYAKEHALSTDGIASVGSSVPTAVISPGLYWSGE